MPAMLPYALYECFVVVVEMFIASLFLGSFFSPSDAGRRRAAGYCAFCAAMMCLSAAQASPAVLLAATAVGVFLLARFFYEGGIASKLMASGLFCVLVVAADIACVWVCAAVWHIESAGVGAYGPERVLFAAVAKLAQILLVKLAGLAAHGRRRAPVAARIREAAPLLACQ
ncbi:MAG: hypothetical protein LBJ10_04850, partial [Clostridiales bacterium]|nr:hypothetical protein [Clostridiales bacterium]MDR1439345.1 hypothetical protein [Clostridiales bacterium]